MNESLAAVQKARGLLAALTPLKTDCGRLCAGACCAGDSQTGMLLFPGEAQLYAACTFGRVIPAHFSLADQPAQLFVCGGSCPREERPLACRLFPLFLRTRPDGTARVTLDPRAAAVCPLCDYGMDALHGEFVQAARQAYDALLADVSCAAYLRALDKEFSL